MKVAAI
jgi:hypothetical protein